MSRRKAPAGDPRRAVAYLRVSTDDQNLGMDAQRAAIVAWAAREGIEVAAWCEDQGVSGSKGVDDRPGLTGALDALRAQGAGVLVVAKRDRLARDVLIAGTVEHLAARAGGRVVSADGVGNGDGPAEQFMRTVIDGAAAFERAQIRARTRAALKVKRERWERTGTVPWGFQLAADGKKLEPCPAERTITARAVALRAEGRSLAEVAAQLAAEGVTTRTGKAPSRFDAWALCRRPAEPAAPADAGARPRAAA